MTDQGLLVHCVACLLYAEKCGQLHEKEDINKYTTQVMLVHCLHVGKSVVLLLVVGNTFFFFYRKVSDLICFDISGCDRLDSVTV